MRTSERPLAGICRMLLVRRGIRSIVTRLEQSLASLTSPSMPHQMLVTSKAATTNITLSRCWCRLYFKPNGTKEWPMCFTTYSFIRCILPRRPFAHNDTRRGMRDFDKMILTGSKSAGPGHLGSLVQESSYYEVLRIWDSWEPRNQGSCQFHSHQVPALLRIDLV